MIYNSDLSEYSTKSILGPNGKLLPEVKDVWITALESGKYKRKVGLLFSDVNPDGTKNMCCLGVLRDVVSPECSIPDEDKDMYYFSKTNRDIDFDRDIVFDGNIVSHEGHLAVINDAIDTVGYSKQIAYIKENL